MAITKVKFNTAVKRYFGENPDMLKARPATRKRHEGALEALKRAIGDSQLNASDLKAVHFSRAIEDLMAGGTPEENARRRALGWPIRKPCTPQSLRSPIATYRKFWAFLVLHEYASAARNPTAHLKAETWSPQKPIHEVVLPSTDENYAAILDAAEAIHPRYRMICALGLYAAFRESEMTEVRISGVNWAKKEITVYRQKQKRYHTVPFVLGMESELRRWFRWLDENVGDCQPDDYLIGATRKGARQFQIGRDGNRIHCPVVMGQKPGGVTRVIQHVVKAAGMPDVKKLGAHTLRRMCAIMVLEKTNDWRMAKTLLGHTKGETTEIYLQYSDDLSRLKAAFASLNPDGDGGGEVDLGANVVPISTLRPRKREMEAGRTNQYGRGVPLRRVG